MKIDIENKIYIFIDIGIDKTNTDELTVNSAHTFFKYLSYFKTF